MKKKNLNKEIFLVNNVEIYCHSVIYSQNQTDEQFSKDINKFFKKKGLNPASKEALNGLFDRKGEAVTYFLSCNTIVIRIFKHSDKTLNELMDSITHEIIHTIIYMSENIELKIERSTDEAIAYLAGHIMNKIILEIIKD